MSRATIFGANVASKNDKKELSADDSKEKVPHKFMHGKGYYNDNTSRRTLKDYVLPAGVQAATDANDESQKDKSTFISFTN